MTGRVPSMSRGNLLGLYRQLLESSKRLPMGQQRDDAVRNVKDRFRANAQVTDPMKARTLEALPLASFGCCVPFFVMSSYNSASFLAFLFMCFSCTYTNTSTTVCTNWRCPSVDIR